jgi:hypothetical protein
MENQAKLYYISREQYLKLIETWSASDAHPAWQHIIYNVLRNKPIDHGFSEKKNHIQCNDPWYGFNSALSEALRYCPGGKCPWTAGSGSANRWEAGNASNLAHAVRVFGIEMPEDIRTKMEGQKK